MMEIEEQAMEENDFREVAKEHLRNVLGKGARCGFFSSFYSEGEKAKRRCLLTELRNESENFYLTDEEMKVLCPFYDPSIKSRCSYEPNYPSEKERLIQTLKETIIRLENES